MNSDEYFEFLKLTKPLIKWLNEKGNPDQSIIITAKGVSVKQTIRTTPAEYILKTVE